MQSSAATRAASRAVAAVGGQSMRRDTSNLSRTQPQQDQSPSASDADPVLMDPDVDRMDMDADYTAMLLALDVLMPPDGSVGDANTQQQQQQQQHKGSGQS